MAKDKKEVVFNEDKEMAKFSKDLGNFLEKNAKINCVDLSEYGDVPYWISPRCFGLSWIISNSFFKGWPGTRVSICGGLCLDGDTMVSVELPDSIYNFAKSFFENKITRSMPMKVKQLFNIMQEYEKQNAVIEKVQIKDENNNLVDINKFVIKKGDTIKLSFDDGKFIIVADEHLISPNRNEDCKFAKDFKAGDIIVKGDGTEIKIVKIENVKKDQDVYDFQIDSDSHLYQTTDGIVHHNSGKGKSLLTDVALGENIREGGISIKVDIEISAGAGFTGEVVGSDEIAAKIKVISPNGDSDDVLDQTITIERMTQILLKIIDFQTSKGDKKNKSVLVVIDSITQLASEKEITDTDKNKDTADMSFTRATRKLLRVITQRLPVANVSVIGIAQSTANIGVMFGPKTVLNTKGSGFTFASSLSLVMKKDMEILGGPNKDIPIGIRMYMETAKNRCAYKGRGAWITMMFGRGINPYGGIAWLLAQYGVAKAVGARKPKEDKSFEDLATVKPKTYSAFEDKCYFVYETKEGKRLIWRETETEAIVKANGGKELLIEWEEALNSVYKNLTEDVDDIELTQMDDLKTEDEELAMLLDKTAEEDGDK